MNKRKILLLIAMLSMAAILGVGGTLAYFTDDDAAKNVFTVGNVIIDLTEPNWDAAYGEEFPSVYPGQALVKDPTVTNIGKNPCFVRVKVEGLDQFVDEFGKNAMITMRYLGEDGEYHDGYNTKDWQYRNGHYYYKKVLATAETAGDENNIGLTDKTTPLFDQIVIPTVLTNKDGLELPDTYSIDVTAYAVQAQGAFSSYEAVKKMSVAQIYVWFNRCAPDEW